MAAGSVRKTLIVARHEEPQEWLDTLPEGWELLLIQKGDQLPNEGREASSFLHGIWLLYPDLCPQDLVACVQGNPFPHCQNLLEMLAEVDGLPVTPLGTVLYSDHHGGPHHPGLLIGDCYREWVGREPPGEVGFVMGAQFVTTGRQILRRPRVWYERMVTVVCETEEDRKSPWVMERLWLALFEEA